MPAWTGTAFRWMGYINTLGLSAIHKRWANIVGTALVAGTTAVTLGLSIADAGSTTLAATVIAGTAITGAVSVAAASLPPNKGLDITASVIGVTTALITMATSVALLGFSALSSAENLSNEQCLGCVSKGLMSSKMQARNRAGWFNGSKTSIISRISKNLMDYLNADEAIKQNITDDKLQINTLEFTKRRMVCFIGIQKK